MKEEFELAKASLQNIKEIIDIKENPVVDSVLLAPIKAIPIIGEMVNSVTDKLIEDFQQKKEQEFIELILKDKYSISSDMVNDVEFIVNYNKTLEIIRRLATNDKIKYFANLIKNGYLSGERIENSEFEEYLDVLNTMSYREIQYLIDYKLYCEEKSKSNRNSYNKWPYFQREYAKKRNVSGNDLWTVFMRIKQTGFLEEEYETESGDVDEDLNTIDSLSVESSGFCIVDSFNKFYKMVLETEDRNNE